MKRHVASTATASVVALALAFGGLGAPASADDQSDAAVAGALAILGIAAMAHHKDHYHEGYAPANELQAADFERGYRDGLHNEPYDPLVGEHYARGYDAGQKERANRLAHKSNGASGAKVPRAAMDACFQDAVKGVFQTSPGNVHVIKTAQEGADNFYIELAHGHKHVVCSVNSKGEIFNTEYRRL
jgi:hypothetical protein